MCTKITYDFGRREAPSNLYVRYLVKKVKENIIIIDKSKREKPKTVHIHENIAVKAESVRGVPSTSIHRRSQQFNILAPSLRWILNKDLGMTPNKVQLIQKLKPIDHPMRFRSTYRRCRFSNKSSLQMKLISSTSIHRRSQQFNILATSLRWILNKDLGMMPYKVQLVQKLKPINHPMRFRFAKWICDRLTEDADCCKNKSPLQMKLILILANM